MNKKGFTLTEVMIGMAILTIAIVTATNLLISLTRSNASNVNHLQAFYMAQEGIEAVRNIRDTNWLHNFDWMGRDDGVPWGAKFEDGGKYVIDRNETITTDVQDLTDVNGLLKYAPWRVSEVGSDPVLQDGKTRVIKISDSDACKECKLIDSTVTWKDGSKENSITLSEILSNWKGGAL